MAAIITLALLGGCDEHSVVNKATGIETVETGSTVLVYPGDTITPLTGDTKVDVNNIYNDGYSSVTVLSGSIELVRG